MTLCLLWVILPTKAQVLTQRFPVVNKTTPVVIGLQGGTPTLTLPAVDVPALLTDDERRIIAREPYRFGTNLAVDISLTRDGSQTRYADFQVYQYQLFAPGAYSLNLLIDRLQLAPGAALYFYNPGMTILIGPITQEQNLQAGEFWSDLIQGERLIMELHQPVTASQASEVHVYNAVHGYRNVFPTQNKAFMDAGNCEINMACYPDFQFEGDGVVILLTQGGSAFCSGSIINDSRQSFRSFLLSANHCGSLTNSLVRFRYQSPACQTSTEPLPAEVITMNGTTFRANYAGADVSLHELNQQIPASANATYLGWNRNDGIATNAFGIHHPEGDLKKISFTNADTQVSSYGGASTHKVFWGNLGVTEPGSSGSPLFDGNRRVIGQLYGGASYCGAPQSALNDHYGRFFTSWTGGGTNSSRLSNWLDPTNLGNTTTNGVKPVVDGPATITGNGSFSVNVGTASIVSWSISGAAGAVTPMTGSGNAAYLTALSAANALTITFSVAAGQSYPIVFSKVFNANPCAALGIASLTNDPAAPARLTATASGSSFVFTGPGGYVFSSVFRTPGTYTVYAPDVTTPGVYTLTVSDKGGCQAPIRTITVN